MTKERVEEIVKRYPFVIKAIKEGKEAAEFQISKRNFKLKSQKRTRRYVRSSRISAEGNGIRMFFV